MKKTYSFFECLAHTPDDKLVNHLESVANGVWLLWDKKTVPLTQAAYWAGLFHDLGKASRYFQEYLSGNYSGNHQLKQHSLSSALLGYYLTRSVEFSENPLDADKQSYFSILVFLAILHHHKNLEHTWSDVLTIEKEKLRDPIERSHLQTQFESMDLQGIELWLKGLDVPWKNNFRNIKITPQEIIESFLTIRPLRIRNKYFNNLEETLQFIAIFSSLIQCDKIHSASGAIRNYRINLPEDSAKKYIQDKCESQDNPINRLRNQLLSGIQETLINNKEQYFFTVTAPTGSGKTLAVLNAVLQLMANLSKNKIRPLSLIYCLPFTSIVDQNYEVYKKVLNCAGLNSNESNLLLKHHHLGSPVYETADSELLADSSGLFIESWQSTIVVTTFYQLLYGIFTGKNRELKRFISLKDSVVVLDEVQAIPYRYWEPVREAMKSISNVLGTRFILMTATQPLLFTGHMSLELVEGKDEYFKQLSRFSIHNMSQDEFSLSDYIKQLIEEINERPDISRMVVLNRKKTVTKVYQELKETGIRNPLYALSTFLTPRDRKNRINDINIRLKAGEPVIIVTTQLIEAGVDISVDTIDRDMAPLDSIIQSAGRCNRHGGNTRGPGIVRLWNFVDDKGMALWKKVYDSVLIDATKDLLKDKKIIEEKEIHPLGQQYYELVYQRTSADKVDDYLKEWRFEELENEFHLIEETGLRQSYYISTCHEDYELWNRYNEITDIKDPFIRQREYSIIKAEFMERIIQVFTRNPTGTIEYLDGETGCYNPEYGYIEKGESNIIL